jgi:hypothetical protein
MPSRSCSTTAGHLKPLKDRAPERDGVGRLDVLALGLLLEYDSDAA